MTSCPDPRDPADPGSIVSAGGIALDELADLQAGLLTPDQESALRARMAGDPDALALYGLLEQTRLELADLDDEPVPDDVAERIDTALAAEPAPQLEHDDRDATPTGPEPATDARIVDLDAARRRRRRLVPALIAAAVVVIGIVGGIAVFRPAGSTGPTGLQAGNAPAVGAQDLASLWPEVSRYRDLGFLTGSPRLASCLSRAPGPVLERDIVGAQPIVLDDQDAVLVATRVPMSQQIALTAFAPDCNLRPPLAQTLIDP
ncbi:hypothetical protein [Actinomycetospora soli]|uniref:hypothetical protein n=1 Tax=Actinomycetospora soli TaxID=2893887 RepID=UPI001E2C84B2|nr:hypothetical protein [Actinomycetospora soli]MCD2191231.1 hypothetical protein [Actinomycetospora soli]